MSLAGACVSTEKYAEAFRTYEEIIRQPSSMTGDVNNAAHALAFAQVTAGSESDAAPTLRRIGPLEDEIDELLQSHRIEAATRANAK